MATRDYSVGTFTDNSLSILRKRYLSQDETVDGMLDRVSGGNPRFRKLMSTLRFLPNSPTLFNAGLNNGCTLSACFTADTVIHTLAGDFTVSQLLKDNKTEFEVFSTNGKSLKIGKAFGLRKTRTNAVVYRVTFDTGDTIKLTSDHLVMLRDGSYKEAGLLKAGDSVMPFNYSYQKYNSHKRRFVCPNISDNRIPAYRWVFREVNGRDVQPGHDIHHNNHNPADDSTYNLVELSNAEHAREYITTDNPMKRPEVAAKISQLMIGNKRGVGPKPGTAKAMRGNQNAAKPEHPDPRVQRNREKARERSRKRHAQTKGLYNHKVVSIEYAGQEDVYDLSVHTYHNFAANGVFIHNCFVFDVDDEMGPLHTDSPSSIHNTRGKAIGVAKAGGGVGYYFGHLRPKNSLIKSIHRKACGPVAVLRDYHGVRQLITQGGKRDLAQMGVLPVWHADVEEFIQCKVDNPKALESFNISVGWTNDYIKNVQFNVLRNTDFNVSSSEKSVNRETLLWKMHCEAAWEVGCPGILFPDVINASNFNKHLGLINATNPCLTAETLVAVADGRGSVPIGELARIGKDIPVYCQDDEGKVAIRMMRHPRLTGSRKPIIRVNLDNGRSITCTRNHKFLLRTGEYVEANSLKPGDSLRIMTRYIPEKCSHDSQSYYDRYIGLSYRAKVTAEHVMIAEFSSGREVLDTEHVHHKDENKLNNRADNLEIMDGNSHLEGHSYQESNANAKGVTNQQLLEHGKHLARQLGRRFSRDEWECYARDNGLPTTFRNWREQTLGSWVSFSRRCAELEDVGEYNEINPKRVRIYQNALEAGLNAEIMDGEVIVHKVCENCKGPFTVPYNRREQGYCSKACSNIKQDKTKMIASLKETNDQKQAVVRDQQIKVFMDLTTRLGRTPQKSEWKEACKQDGISFEISRKSSPFRSYRDLIDAASSYNHKVVSVEPAGYADVYNGTVDDYHNFFLGGFDEGLTPYGRRKVIYCNSVQCGETPNRNNEPCNLGSIVASRMYSSGNRTVDWNLLEETVRDATDFLDDILDRNVFPHPEITRCAMLTRKLGLGVMGWTDLLSLMHIHYDSDEAIALALKWSKFVQEVSHNQSELLAAKKGVFPGYDADKSEMPPRRNETTTSIAPTGTIAIIAGCDTWSIEPLYDMDVERTTNEGLKLQEQYRAEKYDGFIPKVAHQLSIEAHIDMQAAFQRYTDLGVSKTINLPNSATVQDVSKAYQYMYSKGCKGGTIYRDGCRTEQVLVKKETSVYSTSTPVTISPRETKAVRNKLAAERFGSTVKFKVAGKAIFLTHNQKEDGSLGEILINGNFGTTIGGLLDAWCITMSVALQSGVPLEDLVDHHQYKRFEPCGMTDNKDVPICTSVTDFIVRWLKNRYIDSARPLNSTVEEVQAESGMYCPECSSETIFQSGCLVCTQQSCGWTRCG